MRLSRAFMIAPFVGIACSRYEYVFPSQPPCRPPDALAVRAPLIAEASDSEGIRGQVVTGTVFSRKLSFWLVVAGQCRTPTSTSCLRGWRRGASNC